MRPWSEARERLRFCRMVFDQCMTGLKDGKGVPVRKPTEFQLLKNSYETLQEASPRWTTRTLRAMQSITQQGGQVHQEAVPGIRGRYYLAEGGSRQLEPIRRCAPDCQREPRGPVPGRQDCEAVAVAESTNWRKRPRWMRQVLPRRQPFPRSRPSSVQILGYYFGPLENALLALRATTGERGREFIRGVRIFKSL